ncbi:MFS transporter [Schlesneria sp. T3-172]|uniref:MFS transporter n=2 Tax=Schlesneria TaxID=656899 RepID=UPI0037C58278
MNAPEPHSASTRTIEDSLQDSTSTNGTSFGQWMALIAALLGWMFDGAEMGVFSMVGRAAIQDLLGISQPSPESEQKVGLYFSLVIAVFLVGAATGGVLFGWLGDRIGRVRAMSLSVLTYALFTGLCGFAQTPIQLGILRFIAALGMGGEWSLGVALVMEVWPNRSRALMAGLIGAAANAGYLLVGIIGIGLAAVLTQCESLLASTGLPESTVSMLVANKGWRLMMMLGTLPAGLTFFFRLFVPESTKWEREHDRGSTSNWVASDLIGVLVGAIGPGLIVWVWADERINTTWRLAGTFMGLVIATLGYIYPVVRFLQRTYANSSDAANQTSQTIRRMLLGACLSGIALIGTWGSTQWAMSWAGQLTQNVKPVDATGTPAADERAMAATAAKPSWIHETITRNPREYTQIVTAVGAIIGTILAAMLGDWVGRRIAYCALCFVSMASVLWFYQFHSQFDAEFLFAAFLLGTFTASFYGWLPLYLPELYTTNVRATGQGFSFNFGRILAAIGTLQIGSLLAFVNRYETFAGLKGGYPVACSVVCFVYVIGMILIWVAPETKGKALPE